MTLPRSFAILCICFLFRILPAQQTALVPDSVAADSTDGILVVPNVFSPNGDGFNDHFVVTTNGVSVYEFSLFTRTGTRVFYSRSPTIFWDGKSIGGEDLKEGIYYYVIEESEVPEPFQATGFIHLFR
jgi:gliding motility-associated-like protein